MNSTEVATQSAMDIADIPNRLARATSTAESGNFFPTLLEEICSCFDLKVGLVGHFLRASEAGVQFISSWPELESPYTSDFSLEDTPWGEILESAEPRLIEKGLPGRFPKDELISSNRLESSFGFPLKGSSGENLGLIVFLHDAPFPFPELLASVMENYLPRCASELEQQLKTLQLRQIFKATEQSPCSIVITDRQGNIEYVNPKFTELTGYSCKDVLGKNPRMFTNPSRPVDGKTLWETLCGGKQWNGLFHNLKKSGEPFTERASISPIFNESGEITHFVAVKEDLTSIRDAETEIRRSEQRFRNLIDQVVDAIILFTPEGEILDVNKKACSSLGYSRDELLGMNVKQIDQNNTLYGAQPFWSVLPSEIVITVKGHHLRKNGDAFPVEIRMGVFEDDRNSCVIALARDISDRIASEKELQRQKDLLQNILDNIPHAVFWKDTELIYQGCNRNFAISAGYSNPEEVIGKSDLDLPWRSEESEFYRQRDRQVIESAEPLLNYEQTQRQADGKDVEVLASKVPLRNREGGVTGVLSILADITELKKTQAQLDRMANYDSLTGLPNKTLFHDRLTQSLGRCKRRKESLAILCLDLDHFEKINTTLGHSGGDRLLKEIADRVTSVLRSDDTVAKLGGDSFAILLPGLNAPDDACLVASKILTAMQTPFRFEENEIFVSGTIGISVFPGDGESGDVLLRNASTALNRAKAAGRNSYLLYTQGMNDKVMERLTIENNLRKAIQSDELVLFYQPQVDARENRLIGAEALARWIHPEQGMISPGTFIPLAEETGLIIPLGEWVLREACRQIRQWQDNGLAFGKVSVNIAAQQLMETDLPTIVESALQQYDIDPSMLSLEITESSIMHDIDKAIAVLQRLKNMGLHLAIDDFGTGYSSLSYLKKFPVDVLKIDRSFVFELPANKDDGAIVSAIIAMAHNLGLDVLAEGVETVEQLNYLVDRLCVEIQGFYFSPPMKAEDFAAFTLPKNDE